MSDPVFCMSSPALEVSLFSVLALLIHNVGLLFVVSRCTSTGANDLYVYVWTLMPITNTKKAMQINILKNNTNKPKF